MIPFRLLLAALPLAGPVHAQSFDCAAARTMVERLVCADRRLGALDAELGAAVKASLAADPAKRAERLAEARRWIIERDRLCPPPAREPVGEAKAQAVACLAAAYQARLAALRAPPADDSKTAACRTLGERYRAVLASDPGAPFRTSFYAASPLAVLSATQGSGVTIASPVAELGQYSRRAFTDWSKAQPQPFTVTEPVLKALDELSAFGLRIERLPGHNFYSAGVIEGTAACYSTVYFIVEGARAHLAVGPASWEGEGGAGCGVSRSFGSIDGAPAAFEESHDYTPSLISAVSVTPWRDAAFGETCSVDLRFAPRFTAASQYNDWDVHCDGADCERLRGAALALVEAAQADPLGARARALARLTAGQILEFSRAEAVNGPPAEALSPAEAAEPSSYTDNAPLLLPLVDEGRVYLAALGHFTVGWRVFADWRVGLKQIDKDALTERAVFAIGMTKGELRSVETR
ncbi:hypothetical protein Ms3S1_08380 [Methylosinus sp. 3S-1]|uniref:DUF1311 domain-containing protein n=2 Tax=Methylocystaceae TaxID=31993 RepID=A0A2D2CWX4_METT3|nr:DUF1311 domain-containing protein [Methylosinus trichosporium OB3b]OBS52200.1 hypothetical protein A8B73_12230 [Methylosinus sp. 3S-1]